MIDHRYYGFDPSARIDESPVPLVVGYGYEDRSPFTMASGRMAVRTGEIVLGHDTASTLGVDIGDTVHVEAEGFEPTEAAVVGTMVLPTVGPFIGGADGSRHRRVHACGRRSPRAPV